MKITFVFNNTLWATEAEKIKAICDFYKPIADIVPNVLHTSFTDIPFEMVSIVGGIENTAYNSTTVLPEWFSKNITVLAPDSDIIVLYLNDRDDNPPRTSVGIMHGKYENVVQCCIFGLNETNRAYIYDKAAGTEIDQGNSFVVFTCHEISHALYLLEGKKPDNTHAYFYTAREKKVLDDLVNPRWFLLDSILNFCYQLLGLYKQQTTIMHDNNTSTANPVPLAPQPQGYTPYMMIYTWAKAIERAEGARLQLNNPGNLKVSTLTKSWGAQPGFNATDGGSIAKFPTYQAGLQALCNFLTLGCENQLLAFHQARTLGSFTKIYAGNPPQGYIDQISYTLKVPVDTDISTFLR